MSKCTVWTFQFTGVIYEQSVKILFVSQRMKCPLITADGGPVISLERNDKNDTLAIVWMSIDSPQNPISGYLVFLNDQQCGKRVRLFYMLITFSLIKYDKCSKISNTLLFLFSKEMLIIRAGILQNACQNSKQGRPRSDCFFRSSLIWVCIVCLDLFCNQLVFKILEHLRYEACHEKF